MKGDIVLVPFPNSDLSTWKRRPALVLYDILITRGTSSFEESGLNHNSVIKINKITTIKTHFIAGLLGSADESLQAEVNRALDAC